MFFCFLFVSRCSNIYNNGCTECAAQTCSRQRKTITTNMKINITADAMRQRNPPANPHSPITSKIRDRLIDLLRLTYVQNFHVTNVECLRSDEKKNENCGRCSRARSKSKVKVICVELEYFIAFICNSECICISFSFVVVVVVHAISFLTFIASAICAALDSRQNLEVNKREKCTSITIYIHSANEFSGKHQTVHTSCLIKPPPLVLRHCVCVCVSWFCGFCW